MVIAVDTLELFEELPNCLEVEAVVEEKLSDVKVEDAKFLLVEEPKFLVDVEEVPFKLPN